MEEIKTEQKKTVRRKKKLTQGKNIIPNSAMPVQNKYVEAALKHQGSFIVYDPNFML